MRQGTGTERRSLYIGLLILAVWAIWALGTWWDHWPSDLSALYFAAWFFADGDWAEVYASPARFFGTDDAASWQAAAAAMGHAGEQVFPYIYPPLWAAVLAPVAKSVSPTTFFQGVYVWHVALMALAPVLAYRIMRPPVGFGTFAAISVALLATSIISKHALFQNQPQITVSVLVLLGFERLASGRPVMAGIALGLATAIKLSPVAFILVFLVERQYRAALACAATVGAAAGLSLALAGWDLHRIFLGQLALVAEQLVIFDLNLSLRAAAFQLWELAGGRTMPAASGHSLLLTPPSWLGPLAVSVLAAGAAGIWAATRALPPADRLRLRLLTASLLIPLCAPLSWAHHYLIAMFLVPGLIAWPRFGAVAIVLFGLVLSEMTFARLPGALAGLNPTVPAVTGFLAILVAVITLTRTSVATGQPRRT